MTPSPTREARPPLLLAGCCTAFLALVVAAVAIASQADVIERGSLLSWAGDDVRRVDAGGVRFYLSSEFDPKPDALTTWILAAAGSVAAFAATLLWTRGSARTMAFFVLSAAGAWYLALDEGFAVHESLGHNLGFLADVPGVKRPDDLVFGLYAVGALAFLLAFRRTLLQCSPALALFGLAFAMTLGVSFLDFVDVLPGFAEEGLEIATSGVVLLGYVVLARALALEGLSPG
ncbi:MAG: hypothetical protein HOQ03_03135 [Thermoleophilia bacterium]|nr:hypothetical protein [Thermoleophilia bacterium]